ncbi:penicillin-binding protein activator LpoB [Chondromyces apiculatus]|uniref:Putative lipoprotein n=1 Tax=Chondromyces apiculatus DSM 436 TaxID=1192034 RepID=A0A017SVX2_9BACT|nr:penicillin-binding protein activator LpoB [Chondromyces apiculatus]EYF00765.1 putative lipoprotein [Chondromyces apiculatus DSM 436]
MPDFIRRSSTSSAALVAALVLAAPLPGCGPTYVRGNEVAGLDDQAMSTGLDKRDIDQLLHENLKALMASPVARQWAADGSRPTLAIYPLANETSEHIDSQLMALLSDVETFMVNSQLVTVISVERQMQMIGEIEKQHGGGFDPRNVAEYNRQLGARYYLTGKVFTSDERAYDERRVQYFMFMQLIEVATSAVLWQNKAAFTKALIQD